MTDIAIRVENLSKRYRIGKYVGEGKVEFDFTGMYEQIQSEREVEIISFSAEIFEETLQIEEIVEIHDRIIAAAARFYGSGIMTKDPIIQESGEVEVL